MGLCFPEPEAVQGLFVFISGCNMSIIEIIKDRRSIRSFQSGRAIPQELTDRFIEALIWAPSAGNLQSRKFYFVYNDALKQELARAALGQSFITEAPLVIVGCADLDRVKPRYGSRGVTLYAPQDVAASVQNLMLVAHEAGLGTCWIGAFDEDAVSKAMKLPAHLRPVAIVPVGYPAKKPSPPPRMTKKQAIEVIE